MLIRLGILLCYRCRWDNAFLFTFFIV